MSDIELIDLTPGNIADYGVCGYKDAGKHLELRRKIDWFARYYPKGLRIKALISEKGGYQGMLEYIPGKYAHRPVSAEGYMFIHCLFVGFRSEFKGRGYASSLIDSCIGEEDSQKMLGVAVVTRKGSFMVGREIFIKKGFVTVDSAKPDFELLVLKFNPEAPDPGFKEFSTDSLGNGLIIMRSPQCPYSVKNVEAILQTAKELNIEARLIEMEDAETAQNTPGAFGTFCIIYNGEVISHHPISNSRFKNIMAAKSR